MIEFKKVSYTYFSKFYTLFNFSYKFDAGNYALVGDNVSGPLTLIRLLAKLDTYYKGEILVDGKSLKKVNFKRDFQVGYISATPKFFNNKSVLENVAYPLKSRGVNKQQRIDRALIALSNFAWKDKAYAKVNTLSKTELIMLAIIRASVRKLDLLLCENVFDSVSPSIINRLDATTKIVVTEDCLDFTDYTTLIFDLGSLDNKKQG